MQARDRMTREFRLLDADLPRAAALSAVRRFTSEYVVVRSRGSGQTSYFVYLRADVLERLGSSTGDVYASLALRTAVPTPTIALHETGTDASTLLLVVSRHGPAGIVAPARVTRSFSASREWHAGRGYSGDVRSHRGALPDHREPSLEGLPAPAGLQIPLPVPDSDDLDPPQLGTPRTNRSDPELQSRTLTADFPERIQSGTKVSLLVALQPVQEQARRGAPLAAPLGSSIDVIVEALQGLSLIGPREGTLQLTDSQSTLPLQFKFEAGAPGPASLRVYGCHNGAALVALDITASIVESAESSPARREQAVLPIEPRAQPDLAMYVFERADELSFRLQSADGALHMQQFGPVRLVNPRDYFRSFFADLENLPLDTPERRKIAKRKLDGKGANLFETVLPPDLKVLLWDLRQRIKTVQITSDEPWIPWELCRLTGKVGGRVEDGAFFAEAFSVTRWLYGVSASPRLRFGNWAVVVPPDSELEHAAAEKQLLLSLQGPGRSVTEIAPTYLDLTDAMASGRFDAWHFTGHARAEADFDADRSVIELTERQTLSPADLAGQVENVLLPRPFVFLNGCQSARSGLSLTGVGGWAQRLLKPGSLERAASAFIGSYWAIDDGAALQFAEAFYARLFQGTPIGEAARDARSLIRHNDDPTWLAYTVYADPNAKVALD